jgi:putative membrane protein
MRARLGPLWSAAAFAAMLWFWHAPGPYTATFESDLVYWLMHLTTFGAACWLWSALLDGAAGRLAGFVAATVLTTGQMGLLGAVITFAGRPLYPPHQFTTLAWGILPMTDQQLGGVIMWVPAGVIFAGALAFAFTEALRRAEGGGVSGSLARG